MTSLRPLEVGDIVALQAIDRDAHGEAWSHAAFVAQIDDAVHHHLVATDTDGAIVGHAATWLDDTTLRITNVATSQTSQGTGVATELLGSLLRAATDAVTSISLEVRPSNRRAQRLYGRFGFAPVGVVRDFYDRRDDKGSTDALVMAVAEPGDPSWRERIASLDARAESGPEQGAAA